MNKKWILLTLLVIAMTVLSACSFTTGQPASSSNQAQPRVIAVAGSGKVYITPDIAYVAIGVQTQNETVADALTANNDKAQQISKALQDLGIQAKDIQTSSFNVYPSQQTGPDGKPLPTTFIVDNTVNVTVRDLTTLGKLLDTVVRVGANTINGVTFDVTDRTKAVSEARKLAVQDARKQADEIAAAAGVQVDTVQSMSVSVNNGPVPLYDAKAVYGTGGAAQVPVSAGQMTISVDVSASYLIK
jgi:uncharacterized protein